MKVRQAIELARGLKQIDQVNYPDILMLQFLNECEGKLQTEFLHIADVDCQRYTEDDMEMDLIVGPPHDKLYYAYLCAMIDFTNGEYAKYNNSIIVANAFMAEWAAWFNRTHERDGRQYLGVFLSAYGIAVKHGYAGTEEEWLASLEGPAGPQGPQGKPGPQGAPGSVTFDELTEEQLAMLKGPEGPQGVPGIDGQDGIGIQFVEQTTTSTEDGGTNVVTVTKTDGTTSTFYVRNGSRGSTGPAGSDGQDGVSPTIGANGNWYVGKTDTGVAATSSGVYVGSGDMPGGYNLQIDPEGEETDFIPHIGSNGNWFVGNTDLEVPATGPIGPVGPAGATGPAGPAGSDGQDGVSPTIGANGNWYVGQTDTGVPATGPAGPAGEPGPVGPSGPTGPQGPAGPALAVTNTAAVGQTVKITAVDENGQPTEWEAVDMASGGGEGSQKMELLFEVKTTEEVSTILSGVNPSEYDEITMICQTVAADGITTTHLDWIFGAGTVRLSNSLHATQRRIHTFHAVKNADGVWIGQISMGQMAKDIGTSLAEKTNVSGVDAVTVFYGDIKTNIGCQAYVYGKVNLAIGTILKVYGRKS